MRRERETDAARQGFMAELAEAPAQALKALWAESGLPDDAEMLRGPETGLVTVRGRIGGGGAPFNFGEATVTRASVKRPDGTVGHSYALGRDKKKARIAAILDALWQSTDHRAEVESLIAAPLAAARAERDTRRREEAAATKVDFFTMVRGED